jgi:exosortase
MVATPSIPPATPTKFNLPPARSLAVPGLLAALVLWSYWPSLLGMASRWTQDPHYNHGWFVPVFSAWLLWQRRGRLKGPKGETLPLQPEWWGVALMLVGLVLRLIGARFFVDWIDSVSLLPSLAGIAVLLGGRRALWWSWEAILFLVFMMPLPYQVEIFLGWRLQEIATAASTYTLQVLGLPAVAQGHLVRLGQESINVAEACNGLGMLLLFFTFSVGAALVIRRPWFERVLIVLVAPLNAIVGNVTRIAITALLKELAPGGKWADVFYHDVAGYLMMPLALGLLWAEMQLFSRLTIESAQPSSVPMNPLLVGGRR